MSPGPAGRRALADEGPPGPPAARAVSAALAGRPPVAGWRRLRLGPLPEGAGWVVLGDALAPGAVERWVASADAGLAGLPLPAPGGSAGGVPAQVAPTYVLGWVLDALAWAGGVPYGLARRVPPLGLDRVGVRRAAPLGQVDAVALLPPPLPATGDVPDDGWSVGDADASAAALGDALVAAGSAVQVAWRPRVRVGTAQRWGLLADAVDDVLAATGAARGDAAAGVADADRVLRRAPGPLRGTSRARALPGPDPRAWARERRSCCFAYALGPSLVCSTCPRRRPRG